MPKLRFNVTPTSLPPGQLIRTFFWFGGDENGGPDVGPVSIMVQPSSNGLVTVHSISKGVYHAMIYQKTPPTTVVRVKYYADVVNETPRTMTIDKMEVMWA